MLSFTTITPSRTQSVNGAGAWCGTMISCTEPDWKRYPVMLNTYGNPGEFVMGQVRRDLVRIEIGYADGTTTTVAPTRGYVLYEIPAEHIVKGYDLGGSNYVVLTDDDLSPLAPKKSREIDLETFVPVTVRLNSPASLPPPLSLMTCLMTINVAGWSSFVIVQIFVSPLAIVPAQSALSDFV